MISNESKVKLNNFKSDEGLDRGANFFKEILWYFVKVIFFLSAIPYPNALKCWLLRLFGATVGHGVNIKPRVNIHFPWKLIIGNHVWIGEEVFILNFEICTIGNNVCISQRAFLCGGNHDFRQTEMPYRNGIITLQDGSWVGASCFIGPNVIVEVDTIITAGAILTKSTGTNGLYRGNPAELVGQRWKPETL